MHMRKLSAVRSWFGMEFFQMRQKHEFHYCLTSQLWVYIKVADGEEESHRMKQQKIAPPTPFTKGKEVIKAQTLILRH